MTILTFAALAALFAFLAWRARRNPLFLAGGAVFLALGRSAFMDILPDQALVQAHSVSLMTGDLMFAALALGWLYARRRRAVPQVRMSARWSSLGALLAAFVVVELAATLASADGFQPMDFLTTRNWFYIPLGYLMTLDILRRFSRDEVLEFVRVLCLVTTCLTPLYIASALGAPIYPYPKAVVVAYEGASIVRDFATLPWWFGLAWCYYLSRWRWNWWTVLALGVLAGGALASYTRSIIVMLLVTTVIAAAFHVVHRGGRVRTFVVVIVSVALAWVAVAGVSVVAPSQYAFLQGRFADVQTPESVLTAPNVASRVSYFRQARIAGSLVDPVFGAGLYGVPGDAGRPFVGTYDSDWIRLIYYSGWAGIVVFAAPLLLALWWGGSAARKEPTSSVTGTLLLTGVLTTALWFGLRFMSTSYFYWPALSLFGVTLIAYATARPVATTVSIQGPGELRDEPAYVADGR
jgi:hypothetical protein